MTTATKRTTPSLPWPAAVPAAGLLLAGVLAACGGGGAATASAGVSGSAGGSGSPAASASQAPVASSAAPSPTESAAASASAAASGSSAASPPGASGSPGASGGADSAEVELEGFQFEPRTLTVAAGTTVEFDNKDGAEHTVTHGTEGKAAPGAKFDEVVDDGASVEIDFADAGDYPITCRFHPTMQMTVTVTP